MSSDTPAPSREHVEPDRMLDLVHGLLVPADARAAVAHITCCPPCEVLLREHAGTRERARAVVASAGRMQGWPTPRVDAAVRLVPGVWIGSPPPPAPRRPSARRDRAVTWGVSLAAAACVSVALLLPAHFGARTEPARPWLPDPGDLIVVRDEGLLSAELRDGLLAYANRDLEVAGRLLAAGATAGPGDQMRRVYLADVMLRTGRPGDALRGLRSVRLSDLPEPWCSEARWMLMLALRRSGETARADSMLRALATAPGVLGARARAAAGTTF